MADQILVRLIGQGEKLVQWLPVNSATPSEPKLGTLQDLADSVLNKPVILLLPACDILLLAIDVPVKSDNQVKKALPFALEDLLADDVESYHLAWHRQHKEKVYVAAINHNQFKAYLVLFDELGIELSGAYPESLCLPYQNEDCLILIDHQNVILRTGSWLGGGIDIENLPAWVNKFLAENPNQQSIQVWHNCEATLQLELPVSVTQHELDSPMQLFQVGFLKLGKELNLLTGTYDRKNSSDLQWRKLFPALGVFILAALLQTGLLLNNYWLKKSELASLESQTFKLFKQTFPDVKRIVNLKVQAEQQLVDLQKQGQGNNNRFMRMLYMSGEKLTSNPSLQIQQLDFANHLLQLQLTVPDIGQLEQFKKQLESSNLSVMVLSAESSQNTLEAHLEIREK